MQTTRPQIEGMFAQVKHAAEQAGNADAASWELDYAPTYGGWCIEYTGGSGSLGGVWPDANRMPAGDFYRALRMMRDAFERMAGVPA